MSPSAREPRYAVWPTVAMPSGNQLLGRAMWWGSRAWRGRSVRAARLGASTAECGRGDGEETSTVEGEAEVITSR